MKLIETAAAEGHVLCHDITQIIRGVTKDARFRKGHVVTKEDIPVLLSLGKEHLYVWEAGADMLHEDEAAAILYRICAGEHMSPTPVKEGKIEVVADSDGLFLADLPRLKALNALGEMMIATRHSYFPVKKGDHLAGTRVIPLVIPRAKMEQARAAVGAGPILRLVPFLPKKAAIITTGSEIAKGLIQDTFTPVLLEKLAEYQVQIIEHLTLGDEPEQITQGILAAFEKGADLVLCTGGMSVDPDDRTPLAIKNTGARIVSYGAPVLPGAMFLLAYHQETKPVLGLPGCVMYARRTIFDLILPRLMADLPVSAADLAALGHGGLCLNCKICTFPQCGFGKGG
ncbi:MAG: molybdopterin-binding protein [Peptococcaceae bacterium]|jgi:molybdenum cofactor synthesis domain-containing protein|nr:molybdopterin-binding protein [Peptococcaceae bacterium]